MVSFFWKKSPVVFLNDIPCRNILLSLHFRDSDFWDRSSRYHSWRVITKKYRVSFCETALFFDLDDRFFKSIFFNSKLFKYDSFSHKKSDFKVAFFIIILSN